MSVAGVQYKDGGKTYYFVNEIENLKKGMHVIVESEKGLQYGIVKNIIEDNDNNFKKDHMKNVLRIALSEDESINQKNILEARRALHKAISIAKDFGLEMDFVDSNYSFDRTQLTFFFIADSRVDFRELAKNLASIYRTRIELRQIGIRDKAKEISGVGICGRKLCCSCFLNDLDSVSITMAKNQGLALNPSKINGACGRLLCCLNYEDEIYYENRKELPELGNIVKTPKGEGKVISLDILNKKYTIVNKNNEYIEINVVDKEECDKCEKRRNSNK